MLPDGIKIAVVLEPLLVEKAARDRPFHAIEGFLGLPGQRIDAGEVVKKHRFVGRDLPGAAGPFESLGGFPEGDESVGAHIKSPGIVGIELDAFLDEGDAAPPGDPALLGTSEVIVALADEQGGLIIIGADLAGFLVMLDGLGQVSLREDVAGVKVPGFEDVRIEPDGRFESFLGCLVGAAQGEDDGPGGLRMGGIGSQFDGEPARVFRLVENGFFPFDVEIDI